MLRILSISELDKWSFVCWLVNPLNKSIACKNWNGRTHQSKATRNHSHRQKVDKIATKEAHVFVCNHVVNGVDEHVNSTRGANKERAPPPVVVLVTQQFISQHDWQRCDRNSHHYQSYKQDHEHAVDHVASPDWIHDVLELKEDSCENKRSIEGCNGWLAQMPRHLRNRALDLTNFRLEGQWL